ncbi:F-box protein At5g07610-like [Miscanthus floridulus]|uniref:F-box protein At5g07610-like n=1 Tax=Miscanthus floridulus TaxID=154761 RepID=UPI003457E63D
MEAAVTGSASTAAGGGVGLTDDLVVDILSRVLVKSICRFKCVSPSWRNLVSHPDNRKKLPHTVTGFFYFDEFDSCSFVSLAEPPPPPPCDFLPANTCGGVVDCCNGLVLLNNSRGGSGSEPRASYVVCNPATEKWTTVPGSTRAGKIILCFDPAVSVHFHVVQLLDREVDFDDDWYNQEHACR